MSPLLVSAAFAVLVLAVCWFWPGVGRAFMGVFFLLMAVGVNLPLVFMAPHLFVEIGTADPLVGPYARFFEVVVAGAPALWGLLVVAFEAAVGALVLARGRAVAWGVAGGVAFLLAITPMGTFTLADPVLALALLAVRRAPRDRWAFGRRRPLGAARLREEGTPAS